MLRDYKTFYLCCFVALVFSASLDLLGAQEAGRPTLAWSPHENNEAVKLDEFTAAEDFGKSEWFSEASCVFSMLIAEPVAIMVVAASPKDAKRIAEDLQWQEFCKKSGWCLLIVTVQAKRGIGNKENAAAQGWLIRNIFSYLDGEKIPLKQRRGELPIFASLLDGSSDWLLSGMRDRSKRVRAWTARGLTRVPEVKAPPKDPLQVISSEQPASGLLMSSTEKGNLLHWEYMKSIRLENARNRIAYCPYQSEKMSNYYGEDFAREFLYETALQAEELGRWVNYADGKLLARDDLINASPARLAEYIWFPSAGLLGAWKIFYPERPSEPAYLLEMKSRVFTQVPSYFKNVSFHYVPPPANPKAILVMAIDSDRPQEIFQNKDWVDFVRKQNWTLMVVNLQKDSRSTNSLGGGTADWLRSRFFTFLDKGPYKKLKNTPVVLHTVGRPSYWMQRLMVESPERFAAWCVEDATAFAVVRQAALMPPGLIIAKSSKERESLFLLKDLLKANEKNQACLLVAGKWKIDSRYRDVFVRQFLAGIVDQKPDEGIWLRHRDSKRVSRSTRRQKASLIDYVWLPNEEIAGVWNLLSQTRPQIPLPTIKKIVVKTGLENQPKLNLFIRIPGRAAKEKFRPVDGVMCFCTWQKEDASLVNRLKSFSDPLVVFADRNNLAIITWNTAVLRGEWYADLDKKEQKKLMANFDRIGKVWLKGVNKICKENNFPNDNFLLYGISRGTNYAHRLALRHPKKFLAVHTHVCGYYENPIEKASSVLWLVTTGELDGGYVETRKFYEKAQKLSYPILFKAAPNLGHSTSKGINLLSYAFFERALELQKKASASKGKMKNAQSGKFEEISVAKLFRESMKEATYFGDIINHEIYKNEKGEWIPEIQRISLPTEKIAKAWETK